MVTYPSVDWHEVPLGIPLFEWSCETGDQYPRNGSTLYSDVMTLVVNCPLEEMDQVSILLSCHDWQATGLDAWASRVKCPARFVSHLHEICIYIYIYIWVVYSLCFVCCLFITVTWWYVWCIEWASGNQEEVQACLVSHNNCALTGLCWLGGRGCERRDALR